MQQETLSDSTPPCSNESETKTVNMFGKNPGITEVKDIKNVPFRPKQEVGHLARPSKHRNRNHKETEVKSKTNSSMQSPSLEQINVQI